MRHLINVHGYSIHTPEEENLGVLWTGEEFICVQHYKRRGRVQDLKILRPDPSMEVASRNFDGIRLSLLNFAQHRIEDECPELLVCECGAEERKVGMGDILKINLHCGECGKEELRGLPKDSHVYPSHWSTITKPYWFEGYCIVPNFPVDVIAVRTDQKNPPKAVQANPYHRPRLPDIKEKELSEGAGRYVNPQPFQDEKTTQTTNEEGKTKTMYLAWASDFDEEIEFPFRFVKPQVFEDLDRAMQLKIFDRIGVLPARSKGDPMVIGQIVRKDQTANGPGVVR